MTKITEAEALEMRKKLSEYYGEPVRPVSEYCAAFRIWNEELHERHARRKGTDEEQYDGWVKDLGTIRLQVSKSNFLWRLIYLGEKKRTRMCPEHKGGWFGLQGDTHNICLHGCDKTGWLPEDDDPVHDAHRKWIAQFREMPVMLGAEEAGECARAAMAAVAAAHGEQPFARGVSSETLLAIEQEFVKRGLMLCGETRRLIIEGDARRRAVVRHIGYRAAERTFEWVGNGNVFYVVSEIA